jgi:peptidoglycan/xylan/chitin deacetylase (PgdA/CDA1 family)
MQQYAILTYHQIEMAPPPPATFRSLYVAPASFARQMRWLKRLGYRGVSMRDLMPYLRGEKVGKVVGLTFDDGYCNNLQHALPVLQELGFTATCYVMSQLLGKTNVWDIENGVKQADLMTAAQIRQWGQSGMEIGAHTKTHCKLPHMSDADAAREISDCKAELGDVLGGPVEHFCYPYGFYEARHAAMAQDAGYQSATTTRRGKVQLGADLFQLHRIPVVRSTYMPQFLLKLLTGYENGKSV